MAALPWDAATVPSQPDLLDAGIGRVADRFARKRSSDGEEKRSSGPGRSRGRVLPRVDARPIPLRSGLLSGPRRRSRSLSRACPLRGHRPRVGCRPPPPPRRAPWGRASGCVRMPPAPELPMTVRMRMTQNAPQDPMAAPTRAETNRQAPTTTPLSLSRAPAGAPPRSWRVFEPRSDGRLQYPAIPAIGPSGVGRFSTSGRRFGGELNPTVSRTVSPQVWVLSARRGFSAVFPFTRPPPR